MIEFISLTCRVISGSVSDQRSGKSIGEHLAVFLFMD